MAIVMPECDIEVTPIMGNVSSSIKHENKDSIAPPPPPPLTLTLTLTLTTMFFFHDLKVMFKLSKENHQTSQSCKVDSFWKPMLPILYVSVVHREHMTAQVHVT